MAWRSYESGPQTRDSRSLKKFGELVFNGTVAQDLHNSCWPEPPPYVMALHFGVMILQRSDERSRSFTCFKASCSPEWETSRQPASELAGPLGRPLRGRHAGD